MPTKFLVIETPHFQLGANAGEQTEKIDPASFPARLKQHREANTNDLLFVLAPEELRYQLVFQDAGSGPGSVSVAFFPKAEDAIRFLPSIFLFASDTRSTGVKNTLAKGSAIYLETFFNVTSVGSKLDPVFAFARRHLTALSATNAWGSIQTLVFQGLQSLPEQGEKGTGEKVDVQIGADEKLLTLSVRFDLPKEKVPGTRVSPVLTLPRSSAGIFESRFVAEGEKMEFNCLFFRDGGPVRPIEIQTFENAAALENPASAREYSYQAFSAISTAMPEEKRVVKAGKTGFKKKFSAVINPSGAEPEAVSAISANNAPYAEKKLVVSGHAALGKDAQMITGKAAPAEASTLVTGDYTEKEKVSLVKGASAGLEESSTTVKSNVAFGEKETIFKGGATNAELEQQIHAMNITIQQKEAMIIKLNKDLAAVNDPLAKRDVITNIKDNQSEGLKQNIKVLETELEEAKEREKELMKMVDKAVQMKDEAAKKIKELDLKLKQAGGNKGSKEQMLEKQLEEAKRQNKELAARIGEMMAKQRGTKAA